MSSLQGSPRKKNHSADWRKGRKGQPAGGEPFFVVMSLILADAIMLFM
jgi:hypothetical protein